MTPPKITVQGWTENGPAYTIHRRLSGRRNARRRRNGENANELVGPHDQIESAPFGDGPASFMLWALGDAEMWAFKAGYVYAVTILVDGDAKAVLIDAREGDSIEHWGEGLSLLEGRVLEGEDLERALAGDVEQPSNISDGAESQESAPEPEITALNGAQVELSDKQIDDLDLMLDEAVDDARDAKALTDETPTDETAATAARLEAALTPGTPEHAQVVANIGEIANEVAGVEPHGDSADVTPDGDEGVETDSEPTGSDDGRWEELEAKFAKDQITDEELAELAEFHEQARSSSEDDEDAVGGDGDSASDEEE